MKHPLYSGNACRKNCLDQILEASREKGKYAISDSLSPLLSMKSWVGISSILRKKNLRSADDPYRLHESRVIGERVFANRSFSYIAPRLYNKLPITIKQIDSLNTFKSHLKAFLVPTIS